MSEINQINVKKLFTLIGNENVRRIIKTMNIEQASTYGKLSECVKQKPNQQGLTAYYLVKMEKLGLVRHDEESHRWYLTRAALKIFKLVKEFELFCTTYDMADVNADGKVKIFVEVVGRKL